MTASLIIPMYNAEKYIVACLKSIAGQSGKNLEVILVDDGSTDNTFQIIQPFAKEFGFKILRRSTNGGAGAARNTGAKEATGDILIFTDADMLLAPTSVASIITHINKPDVDVVCAIYTEELVKANFFSHFQNFASIYRHSKLSVPIFLSFFCAVKKAPFDSVSGYNESIPSYEDIELGHRLIDQGYQCEMNDNLKVIHLKHYTHKSLLQEYFKKSATAAAYSLSGLLSRRPRNDNCPRALKIAGIFIILLFLSLPLMNLSLSLIFLGLSSFCISPMISYLSEKKGFLFGLKSYLLCFEIYIVSIAGSAYGVINYKKCLNS
jgi:glycosyltransferase involved in cell wall biosynthesis